MLRLEWSLLSGLANESKVSFCKFKQRGPSRCKRNESFQWVYLFPFPLLPPKSDRPSVSCLGTMRKLPYQSLCLRQSFLSSMLNSMRPVLQSIVMLSPAQNPSVVPIDIGLSILPPRMLSKLYWSLKAQLNSYCFQEASPQTFLDGIEHAYSLGNLKKNNSSTCL